MSRVTVKNFYTLHLSDNLGALKKLESNSIDCVVTDPPYGLGAEPDARRMLRAWLKSGYYKPKNKTGFLGHSWDAFVPQPALWKEVYRVLKPGGHVVSFFSSRTLDIGSLAMRLAGFQIRDTLVWVYAQGFPKSQDVGKSLTKAGVKGSKKWSGWGTSLKPAVEPIVLARKPLEGTLIKNITKWNTGALNVERCRVPLTSAADLASYEANANGCNRSKKAHGDQGGPFTQGGWKHRKVEVKLPAGRFPSNFIQDGSLEVTSLFSRAGTKVTEPDGTVVNSSRFFFCPKTTKAERNAGLSTPNGHPTVKPLALMRYLIQLVCPPNGIVLDMYMGSGSTGVACILENVKFVGMESGEESFSTARARLRSMYKKHNLTRRGNK